MICAKCSRYNDVGATAYAAVEEDRRVFADAAAHPSERLDGALHAVELVSAVVRDGDGIGTGLGGALNVDGMYEALDDQLPGPLLP